VRQRRVFGTLPLIWNQMKVKPVDVALVVLSVQVDVVLTVVVVLLLVVLSVVLSVVALLVVVVLLVVLSVVLWGTILSVVVQAVAARSVVVLTVAGAPLVPAVGATAARGSSARSLTFRQSKIKVNKVLDASADLAAVDQQFDRIGYISCKYALEEARAELRSYNGSARRQIFAEMCGTMADSTDSSVIMNKVMQGGKKVPISGEKRSPGPGPPGPYTKAKPSVLRGRRPYQMAFVYFKASLVSYGGCTADW
jgi:hypothetical protein